MSRLNRVPIVKLCFISIETRLLESNSHSNQFLAFYFQDQLSDCQRQTTQEFLNFSVRLFFSSLGRAIAVNFNYTGMVYYRVAFPRVTGKCEAFESVCPINSIANLYFHEKEWRAKFN